jgi:hypothetical protein
MDRHPSRRTRRSNLMLGETSPITAHDATLSLFGWDLWTPYDRAAGRALCNQVDAQLLPSLRQIAAKLDDDGIDLGHVGLEQPPQWEPVCSRFWKNAALQGEVYPMSLANSLPNAISTSTLEDIVESLSAWTPHSLPLRYGTYTALRASPDSLLSDHG